MKFQHIIIAALVVMLGAVSCSNRHEHDSEDKIAEGFEIESMVKLLNHGRTNEVNELLNLKMDTIIIEMDLSLNRYDEKNRRNATNLFQQIAKLRREFPSNDSNAPAQVQEKVSHILMKASDTVSLSPKLETAQ